MLVASPWLLTVWHVSKFGLFQLVPYVLTASISIVMATEEHKYQFQFSTNSHQGLARFMFFSYLLMLGAAVPLVRMFGVIGFLAAWLTTECAQLVYIVHLNHQLFAPAVTGEEKLTLRNLNRLLLLSAAGLAGAAATLRHTSSAGHGIQIASTAVTLVIVGGAAFVLFDLPPVVRGFVARLKNRFATQGA